MKNFIKQKRKGDCGLTCLKILLSNIYNDTSYLRLDDDNLDYCSFFDLVKYASNYGVKLKGVECQNILLLKLPFIAQIKHFDTTHFVLVIRIKRGKVEVFDPSIKKLKYKLSQFQLLFTGNALLVDDYDESKIRRSESNKLPKLTMNIVSRVLNLFILLSAMYCVNNNVQFYWSLGLFALFAIVNILIYAHTIKLMKGFDNCYKNTNQSIEDVSKFKEHYFSYPLKLFNYVSMNVIVMIMTIYNEINLLYPFFLVAIMLLLVKFIKNKYINNKIVSQQIANSPLEKSFGMKQVYRIAHFETISKYLIYLFITCYLLVLMEVVKSVSLNYFVFYFGALTLFLENTRTLIDLYAANAENNYLIIGQ